MPIKTPTIKPAKKLVVHAVSTPLPYAHYQRCTQCDMLFRLPVLKRNQSAWCPRCNAKVRDGRDWSLTRLGSMAVAMLLLMPFAWSEPLLRLHLLGVRIDANVLQGIWQMTAQGDPLTAAMVLFCAVVAPVLLVVSIMDALLIVSQAHSFCSLPCLPYLTIIGALFLCFIELKSIFEKAEDKTRFAESALLAGKIIANKDDLKKLVEELGREKPEKETNDE